MGHKRRDDIHQEIKKTLKSKERFGESKYEAKADGSFRDGIYSFSTAKSYNAACQKFGEYVKEHSDKGRYTPLSECRNLAKEYIQQMNDNPSISQYTVKQAASALGKLFNCRATEFGKTNDRTRENITRSRNRTTISEKTGKEIKNPKTNAGHFSEKNNSEIVNFAKNTGLRRSELSDLRGDQLVMKDGKWVIHVYSSIEHKAGAVGAVGKGGRGRDIELTGEGSQAVIDRCINKGSERVWDKVPGHMDVHYYRRHYAKMIYEKYARDPNLLDRSERYCCRGELKGTWYDKAAMKVASEALGHNRISVMAEHYFY